ncbi:MAG: hypothetical protein KDD39_09160, partial [Bdellovibrionales bacterium]|nr:hypothetical protein [Bdellovibrionales bacterium]
MRGNLYVLLGLLLVVSSLQAAPECRLEEPVPGPNEMIALAFPEGLTGIPKKNYSNPVMAGQCTGFNRFNTLFITGQISCGRPELPRSSKQQQMILKTALSRTEAGEPLVIQGYKSCAEYFEHMLKSWDEKDTNGKPTNPLRIAIEWQQYSENAQALHMEFEIRTGKMLQLDGFSVEEKPTDQEKSLTHSISTGKAVDITLR